MGYLACLLFTCLASFTIRVSKAQSTSGCYYTTCPSCPYGHYNYRYDWRGCQECYCEYITANYGTTRCPYVMCPTCNYNQYQAYRTDWRGCQECYCEWRITTPSSIDSTLPPHPASYWSMSRSSLLSIILNLKQEAQSLLDNAKNTYDHVLHSVIVNDLKKRREAVKEDNFSMPLNMDAPNRKKLILQDETKDQVDNKKA